MKKENRPYRFKSELIVGKKNKENKSITNTPQEEGFISAGQPSDQEMPKVSSNSSKDKQEAAVVKQAIKDDQVLAPVAKDIQVVVDHGTITLEGKVETNVQLNLATNTAGAVGVSDKVKNNLELNEKK